MGKKAAQQETSPLIVRQFEKLVQINSRIASGGTSSPLLRLPTV